MKILAYNPGQLEYYRGNEAPAGGDAIMPMDEMIAAVPNGSMDSARVEEEARDKEKDQIIDAWMTDIKAFIRSIDVSSL